MRPKADLGSGALAGIAAAAAAMATSELLAGLVAGMPSLVVSIGDLAISLQPPGAKDFVVELFGTNDKVALNLTIVIVTLAIAAVAGVLATRQFELGAALFGLFGLAAFVAAARDPLGSVVAAAIAAGVALGAGLVALRVLIDRLPGRLRAARGGAETPAAPDWERRRFLIASAGTIGGAIVVGAVGRTLVEAQHPSGAAAGSRPMSAASAVPDLATDQSLVISGITPIVVPNDEFYRIDTALLVPRVDVAAWKLDITGMVDHQLSFTYDDLLDMPLVEQYVTIACVSNHVGEHLVGNALWTGVRLKELLQAAGVQSGATQIVGRAVDGFTVGFPTDWALAPEREPMVALGMGREPLPAEHGFPARLIIPGLYGYVSATKWLTEVELTTREAVDGYWIPLGWAKDAPILTQSRIDVPQIGSEVTAGLVQVAGVAWAPDRGIGGVEIKVDDDEWRPARISRPISAATWVQWTYDWPATSGSHRLEVRAIDGTGEVQTDQVSAPAPDGARGHHRITVSVT